MAKAKDKDSKEETTAERFDAGDEQRDNPDGNLDASNATQDHTRERLQRQAQEQQGAESTGNAGVIPSDTTRTAE